MPFRAVAFSGRRVFVVVILRAEGPKNLAVGVAFLVVRTARPFASLRVTTLVLALPRLVAACSPPAASPL